MAYNHILRLYECVMLNFWVILQVVLAIFARLPPVLREDILEDVYKVYEPDLLFGVNPDFALQLLATFNRLVNSERDISKV